MTYTAPTFTAGQPALASDIQNLANAVQRVDQTVSVPVVASLIRTNNTTALVTGTLTALTFDLPAEVDTTGGAMTGANDRILITQPGRYIVSGGMGFRPGTTSFVAIQIKVNNTTYIAVNNAGTTSTSFEWQLSTDRVYSFSANDYVQLFYYFQANGGAGFPTPAQGASRANPYLTVCRVAL